MKNRNGFTLTEIMIVVLIIGILLAIAVPNIVAQINAKRNAEICIDNLSMISLAKKQWSIDHSKSASDVPTLEQLTTDDRKHECGVYFTPILEYSIAYADKGEDINSSSPIGKMYFALMPECPCGGKYTIGAIGKDPTCSHQDEAYPHKLP